MHQFTYSALGLIVGLVCVVGGIVLFLHGIVGSMSWTARFLGAESHILDAAPGAILFIVGLFIIWVTRYELKIQGAQVGLGGVYDVYVTGWGITFLVVFIGCYIYAIATYGFLLGVGLGWLPSAIVAGVVATLWPLGALLIAGLVLFLFAKG